MEGPSLFLAAEWLAPFVGQKVAKVSGNTKIEKERIAGKKVLAIFSNGKHLYFQFDTFALRVHFLLFGSFQATVNNVKVTGDYPPKAREPRLAFELKAGHIEMFSCSVQFIETANAKELCDFSIDIMSPEWNEKVVLKKLRQYSEEEIADVLLDQTLFMGVGNIIKNEVLLLVKTLPTKLVKDLTLPKLKKIVSVTRSFVFQFYEWRKNFVLRKHYQIYHQKKCKLCGNPIVKKITGKRKRMSYICAHCEK